MGLNYRYVYILGGGLIIGNLMTCVGHYEINFPIYEKCIKESKYKITNNVIENIFIYLYWDFQFNMINASTTYTKYKS